MVRQEKYTSGVTSASRTCASPHCISIAACVARYGARPRWWQRQLPVMAREGYLGKRGRMFFGRWVDVDRWLMAGSGRGVSGDTLVGEMDFGRQQTRIVNYLHAKTVRQLTHLSASDILNTRGLGRSALAAIRAALSAQGYHLVGDLLDGAR